MKPLSGKRVLVTGGTGSLGQVLVRRLLSGEMGVPERVIVYSRDEAKQHQMRIGWQQMAVATDDVIYADWEKKLQFRIGDVRDSHRVAAALSDVDTVFNAAALKQVPACEYAPFEAVQTNIIGAENIVRAIQEHRLPVGTVVGISTDKACKPVNVMGMTKALQERVFIQANMRCPDTRFVCVRYGNVLASRGSVIPLFHEQIRQGGPVTLTSPDMTRFLLSLDDAVNTVFAACREALPGEIYVPRARSALVKNIALALIADRDIPTRVIGVRPGEKLHEILISEEEAPRVAGRGDWLVVQPMLGELRDESAGVSGLTKEYSSADDVLGLEETAELLQEYDLLTEGSRTATGDLLR